MIVADTNLVAYLLLEGEHTAAAERVLEHDPHWIAPVLWRSEFRNVLALYLRQELLELEQACRLMEEGELLLKDREYSLPSESVLALAASSGCAAYDCEFVALAQRFGIPLVTSDRRILSAFPDVVVDPRRFLDSSRRRAP